VRGWLILALFLKYCINLWPRLLIFLLAIIMIVWWISVEHWSLKFT
jgi:hypothetical protein